MLSDIKDEVFFIAISRLEYDYIEAVYRHMVEFITVHSYISKGKVIGKIFMKTVNRM